MSEMKTYTGSVALREAKPRSKRLQGSRITVTRNSVTDGGAVSTDFDKMFELENTGTQSDPVYRIKAKYGLYTEHFIVAGTPGSGDGGGGGSAVQWSQLYTDSTHGEHIADITIDDSTIAVYAPKGPAAAVGATASDNGYVSGSLLYGILGDSFSASNTLKDFINSSIASNTATFRGTFESAANLPTTGVVNNDYAFVYDTDGDYYRYKYNGSAWVQEYKLNNSGFTAAQWATVNSGLTAAHVSKLDGLVATGSSTLPIYLDSNQRAQTITGLSVPGDVCARNIQVNANGGISAYNSTEAQSLFMLSFNWWMYNGAPNGTIAPEVSDAFNLGDLSHFWHYIYARQINLGGYGANIWGDKSVLDPILSLWGGSEQPYGDIVLGWSNADARRQLRLAAKDHIFIDFAGTTAYLVNNTQFYPSADREAWLGASNKMWKNVFSEDYYAKSFIAWKKRGDTYTAGSTTETATGGFLFFTRYLNDNNDEVWEPTLGVIPGSAYPGANGTVDLGQYGARWNNFYANRWYPHASDANNYIEFDGTNNAVHIVGNLRVDGFIVAGTPGSGDGGGGGGTAVAWGEEYTGRENYYQLIVGDEQTHKYVATVGHHHSTAEVDGLSTALGTKADTVSGATAGHFAGLNASGNLTDSGYAPTGGKSYITASATSFLARASDVYAFSRSLASSDNSTASWGNSVVVGTVGGVALRFTMPANPDTWRPITDDYSGTNSSTSLSQKGANDLYNALLNGYADNAGTVNGHSVNADVPSGAVFTDTQYSAGTGLSLNGTTFSLNTADYDDLGGVKLRERGNIGNPIYFDSAARARRVTYLNIASEDPTGMILPHLYNDLSFLQKRGGSCTIYVDGVEDTSDNSAIFDSRPEFWGPPSVPSTVVVDISLPPDDDFQWGNKFYVDFGSAAWSPSNLTLQVFNGSTELTVNDGAVTDWTECYWCCLFSTSSAGATRLRLTLSGFTSSCRIYEIGVVRFNSKGATSGYMSRGVNDDVWRDISPATDRNHHLGYSGHSWGELHVTDVYWRPYSSNIYTEDGDPVLSLLGTEQDHAGDVELGWSSASAKRDLRFGAKNYIYFNFMGSQAATLASSTFRPGTDRGMSLGLASWHWDKVFAGGLYPLTTANADAKLVYDSTVGGFKVTGNLVVSGNVVSGTAGSSDLEDYVELSGLSSMDEYDTLTSAEKSALDSAFASITLGLIRRIKVSSTIWLSIVSVVPGAIFFVMAGSNYINDGTLCHLENYEDDWRLVTV